jgi:predicted ATPase
MAQRIPLNPDSFVRIVLTGLRLGNWKSFGPAASETKWLSLAPLTLLVGPNASGKSNVLDALRFLQGMAQDITYGDVLRGRFEGQREVWPAIRGHVAEAARFGTAKFSIDTQWAWPNHRAPQSASPPIQHHVLVDTGEDVVADRESLHDGGQYLFDTHAPPLRGHSGRIPGGGLRVALRGKGKGNSPTTTVSASRSILGQVASVQRADASVLETAEGVRRFLAGAAFMDIQPSKMRDYRPENGGVLGTSGENISPALYSLAQEQPGGRLDDVVDWLGELSAPDLRSIEFDRTQLREVMLFLVEQGGHRISARSASDGTLRFLGNLAALLTAPEDTLVVMEEPDVGLHPSRVRVLAELLEHVASRRHLRVMATTHSPMLLASLSEEAFGNVLAFGRDPKTGVTVFSGLRNLPYYDTLRRSDRLAELVSTGWLERAL